MSPVIALKHPPGLQQNAQQGFEEDAGNLAPQGLDSAAVVMTSDVPMTRARHRVGMVMGMVMQRWDFNGISWTSPAGRDQASNQHQC